MSSIIKEYYVLIVGQTEILGVFETLEECLTWRPVETLQESPVIYRIKKCENGTFRQQKILVGGDVFAAKIE